MPITYTADQRDAINRVMRAAVAEGVDLPADLEGLQDEVTGIQSALGGPDAFAQDTHAGLTFSTKAGRFHAGAGGSWVGADPADTVLSASTLNYVECDAAGAVSTNTVGYTAGRLPLYRVTTNGSGITNIEDDRPFMVLFGTSAILTSMLADAAVTGVKIANACETLQFGRQDLPATSNGALYAAGNNTDVVMDGGGYLIGMSAALDAARTNGDVTFVPRINGVAVSQTGLNLLIDGSNTQYRRATVAWAAHAAYAFAAGDRLGVNFTSSGLAPTTLDVVACLRVRRT